MSSLPLIEAAIQQQNKEFTGNFAPLLQVEYGLDLTPNPDGLTSLKRRRVHFADRRRHSLNV
ncbi:MAG: hypothetical protein WDM80_00185 [Limisphaerales bacterium]